jgi:ketosteroid isomerase-like protein
VRTEDVTQCIDEVRACFGEDGMQACSTFGDCVGECADDVCVNRCFASLDAAAADELDAVLACNRAIRAASEGADDETIRARAAVGCRREAAACFDVEVPALSCTEILICAQVTPREEVNACIEDGSPDGLRRLQDLLDCVELFECESLDCNICRAELQACQNG